MECRPQCCELLYSDWHAMQFRSSPPPMWISSTSLIMVLSGFSIASKSWAMTRKKGKSLSPWERLRWGAPQISTISYYGSILQKILAVYRDVVDNIVEEGVVVGLEEEGSLSQCLTRRRIAVYFSRLNLCCVPSRPMTKEDLFCLKPDHLAAASRLRCQGGPLMTTALLSVTLSAFL